MGLFKRMVKKEIAHELPFQNSKLISLLSDNMESLVEGNTRVVEINKTMMSLITNLEQKFTHLEKRITVLEKKLI